MSKHYTIGTLAKALKINLETIRFYHRKGLLPVPTNTRGPYREYGANHRDRIELIIAAKGLGFKLDEIKNIVDLLGKQDPAPRDFIAILEKKISDLAAKRTQITTSIEKLVTGVSRLEETGSAPLHCRDLLHIIVDKPE